MDEVDLEGMKEKINMVEYISQFVDLEYNNNEWWGLCPFHSEKTPSFSVNEEKKTFYCHGCKAGGTIIDFVCGIKGISFVQAVNELAEQFKISRNRIPSLMRISKKFAPKHIEKKQHTPVEYIENPMNKYEKADIKEWIEEGISQSVMNKYDVRYNTYDNRIVFPIRDNEGNIISVKGRTLDPDFKSKKGFEGRKYAYYTSIGTTYFFFGYYENKSDIDQANEIIIFEGEKSVMKLESYGIKNCVASLTDALTDSQVEELIKMPYKNVVIAWDKGVQRSHIKQQVKLLKKYKNVFFLNDTRSLLDDKDSPIDKGIDVFLELYNDKERIS